MALVATGSVIPTGGCCVISVSGISGGPLVTSRAIGSGAYSQIDSNAEPGAITVIVDSGMGLQGPLPNNQGAYSYHIQDSVTGVYVSGLVPVISLAPEVDWLDETVLRCLQAGIANVKFPTGWTAPTVLFEMQREGFPPLPFIFSTPMTLEQVHTRIGQDVPDVFPTPGRELATVSVYVKRGWRQTIYAKTATEREFWRDVVLSIWQSLLGSVFQPLGTDMEHSFMVYSDQESNGTTTAPGFYSADIMYQIVGTFNVGLVPTYGIIETVAPAMTGALTGSSVTGSLFITDITEKL